jgi:hypothetical protein
VLSLGDSSSFLVHRRRFKVPIGSRSVGSSRVPTALLGGSSGPKLPEKSIETRQGSGLLSKKDLNDNNTKDKKDALKHDSYEFN